MAEPRSFADIVASTARHKLAAARARRNPNSAAERPRDVILDGLQLVHEAIARDGYAFASSGPKFVRKCGDLTFQISIQSDRNNAAGQRAAVWAHALVFSRAFTTWSKKHHSDWIRPNAPFPLPIFASQLGDLSDPPTWMEWNFAEKSLRPAVAIDLIGSIRAGAYPLFSTFEAGSRKVADLVDRDWPPPEGVLSYLLSTGHANLACEALNRFLARRPDFKNDFERFLSRFAREGVPAFRTGGAHDLAAFAIASCYPWAE